MMREVMEKLNQLKEKHLEYLRIRNYAESTISRKEQHIRWFIDFMHRAGKEDFNEVTEDFMREYQKHRYYYINMYNRRDGIKNQHEHFIDLRVFFRYLRREGRMHHDPIEGVELPKMPKSLPMLALSDREMRKILKQPDTKTVMGYRDRTILEVLYSTGMRCGELSGLDLEDLNLNEGLVRIRQGKGKKDRMVPIGKEGVRHLETYIKYIRKEYPGQAEAKYLFVSRNHRRLTEQGILNIVKKYAEKAKIEKLVTTHTFRRTCATEMIKRNANPMYVKELLGHTDYRSIQSYCNLSIVDLKKAHQKYHPRERMAVV
jgi:integrase/recombinase XerD